jgi:type II secretory pathway pseudopilin PulG
MNEPLVPEGGGGMNQPATQQQQSLNRSASLLERIRAQREREQQAERQQQQRNNISMQQQQQQQQQEQEQQQSASFGAEQAPVTIPDYRDTTAQDAVMGTTSASQSMIGASSIMTNPFSSFSFTTEIQGEPATRAATQSLLGGDYLSSSSPPSTDNDNNNYSMKLYFLTFVDDVYRMFMSLHVVIRAVLVIFFGWLAWTLL